MKKKAKKKYTKLESVFQFPELGIILRVEHD